MTIRTILITGLLTLAPIFELRGGIPFAIARETPLLFTYFYCVILNALVGPLVFLFLNTVHRTFTRFPPYDRIVARVLERARKKLEPKIHKYEYLGLVLFVAIPLPITGAYTGAIGAWVLGLDPKRSFLAITVGVIIAGIVVSLVTFLGIEALSLFVKEVGV
jgi:uncharacterized membrane protein